MDTQQHWDATYAKDPQQLSWTQPEPTVSLQLIAEATPVGHVIDIGGGASPLAGLLLDRGYQPTVLDISGAAVERAKAALGPRAAQIEWIVADVTGDVDLRSCDVWHDRATFHFLTELAQRAAYFVKLRQTLRPGGHVILATFALDGPEKCSGLQVRRYSPELLTQELGPQFHLIKTILETHHTPWGATQSFQYSLFQRTF